MGVTNVFARKELKYRLTASQDRFLREALAPYVTPDRYGESTICNIYYDTPDFRLIRKSIEKPVYKEKLRLRSYGPAGPDDATFLELKKKYKGIVYKRRISLSERDAMNYLNGTSPLPEKSQISRELDWFLAMAVGLACGMGYLGFAAIFTAVMGIVTLVYNLTTLGEHSSDSLDKLVRITVPEDLEYGTAFADLFDRYTTEAKLVGVKTTNLGSLNRLSYNIRLKEVGTEKALIDDLRVRNGNLEINMMVRGAGEGETL